MNFSLSPSLTLVLVHLRSHLASTWPAGWGGWAERHPKPPRGKEPSNPAAWFLALPSPRLIQSFNNEDARFESGSESEQ